MIELNKIEEVVRRSMLEFLLEQFELYSPKMDGQHHWRFKGVGCWPMNHARGPTAASAVIAAMKEVQRSKDEKHANNL